MEPSNPNQTPNPEQGPPAPAPEQVSAPGNAQPVVSTPAGSPVVSPPPTAPVPQSPAPPTPQPKTTTPTPATAEDVDVIEKEWVDAAQAVVEKNAQDPHAEEEGFEDLQVDYLKKRYGKDIKKPQE
ncbi:MAG TPA: hypothetical protein VLE72_00330 [Candidatus Saccharimonadales bacterium]|nr:hypothetical protein [Candidatus Saccharimonadales bacterium]